jgi:hypothetical protein
VSTPPATIAAHAGELETLYKGAVREGAPKESAFDERAHTVFEFQRSENRLRHALRYESLAKFARNVQEDRENRIKMIEFLQAEKERLEALNADLARRVKESEAKASAVKGKAPAERPK